jgi:catechol 2,3-dioxygenase-like lactoylglutathione lyase family enzyme
MLEKAMLPDQNHRLKRVSHIALVVNDPSPAHIFCTEVLGMRYSTCFLLEYRPGTDIYEPYIHTFYTMDDGTSLAYFVMLPGAPQPTPDWINHPARHFAFHAESNADLPKWAEKLRAHGVEVEADFNESDPTLRFCDPNGVRFEIKAPKSQPSATAEATAIETLEQWLKNK